MVVQMIPRLVWLLSGLMLIASAQSYAEPKLDASVDRNRIYTSDTLNLRIVGNFEMEMSFGGILNFGRNQVGAPDTSLLEQDFEILDQQQSYNMQSINGQTTSQITWNYTLAPKTSGELSIPAIEYKGASTEAIAITVLPGTAPRNADNPPSVFLEVEVDKSSVYVQEQIVYTIRLFAADHLASGDWSDPAPADAIVENLGETKKFFRMAYNQRYEVRERKFLLFPQKSGQLEIEAQSFSGILIDTRSRRRQRVRELSEPLTIEVKPPPAAFSGDTWLPAASLHITEEWGQPPNQINVGDSLTRTIEIQSLGLLGSALPPLAMQDIPGIKVYPDQPEVESFEHDSGVQSMRRETTALVAVNSGTITLPEIRIPWWDTVNDVERMAVVPSRTIAIAPGANAVVSDPVHSAQPANPAAENTTGYASGDSRISQTLPEEDAANGAAKMYSGRSEKESNHLWYTLIALLLTGWAATSIYLWRQLRRQEQLSSQTNAPSGPGNALKELKQAIKKDDNNMPRLLVRWASERFPERPIACIADLDALDPVLKQQAQAFEASRYAEGATANGSLPPYDKKQLADCVDALEKGAQKGPESRTAGLMPFYP